MIDAGITLITVHACTFCWSMWLANFSPSLDLYPDVVWPPRPMMQQQQQRIVPAKPKPPKRTTPKRAITIPGYAPALPVPNYWRSHGKGWEIGP